MRKQAENTRNKLIEQIIDRDMETQVPHRPYFAHQVNAYNTDIEASVLLLIGRYFGIIPATIVNPNTPEHQEGYTRYAGNRKNLADAHKGMDYFFDEVLPRCDSGVMWGYLDGRIGLGVAGEMQKLLRAGKSGFVAHLRREATESDLRRFELDYRNGLFAVRPLTEEEKSAILSGDPRLVIPHLETRLRTWFMYGKEQRPYKEAHLAKMPLPDDFYPDQKK